MDLRKLRGAFPENGTQSANLTNLPANILEAFIPGYSLISKVILDTFGFDVGILVSIGLIGFALVTSTTFLWSKGYRLFQRCLMSSVFVDDGDDLFDSVIKWIAEQRIAKVSRSIMAVTRAGTNHGDKGDDGDYEGALDEEGIFNFGKWAAKLPPRYEPYFGSHTFWHGGRLFVFDRSKKERQPNPWSSQRGYEELIELRCIGRSTKPIKDLLAYIKTWSLEQEKSMTIIRRPAGKDVRRAGAWERVSSRPSRPMETVSLDPVQKRKIVADVNEYLHPSSPGWYATRGIPYRRGYLFHGPPGTGKTSLSFALAGIFGLDIFVVSLLDPALTESDLNRLFNSLPRRCIVLLEDIDTAGLVRDDKSDKKDRTRDNTGADATDGKGNPQIDVNQLARALRGTDRKGKQGDDVKTGISLSGLLNAIDGVATHEGRVLVMTTNHPEKLDEALIRPGRVDMQVEFTLATRGQIRDIFVRMYSSDVDVNKASKKPNASSRFNISLSMRSASSNGTGTSKLANGSARPGPDSMNVPANGSANGSANGDVKPLSNGYEAGHHATEQHRPVDMLRQLANDFAAQIPEAKFSPAEIQGFLLMRKKDPEKAVEEVEEWCEAVLAAREKKAKVLDMQ